MNDKFVDMPKCMVDKYETADFIASDPVQFPRRYSGRDAEVSGLITSDEELTVDEFIRGRMKKVVDSNIETMVESKAKSFVNELRKRYDMAFAAFIVDNMRKQNMLKDEKIAELLKDNPNEK